MTHRFHTLTGLACSLLAIASAPAVWGILALSVGATYEADDARSASAQALQQPAEPAVVLAVAETPRREDEQAGDETARP
jgi:hypothetical protein